MFAAVNLSVSAQKKLPSKIEDGFVLEFAAPFSRLIIQTDEKNLPNRDFAEIVISGQTKLKNHKGKAITADYIRAGIEVEIELDKIETTQLKAVQIKVKTNPEEQKENIDGYLDRVEVPRALVNGRVVELAPNAILTGVKEWKGKTFNTFKDIPLGSLLDLKGIRQTNRVVRVTSGEVRPNLFTPLETKLLETVKKGLTLPPPGTTGAGVIINGRTFKVVDDLELNTYVTKIGMRIVPKYLKMLPEEDPNRVLFRFYVLEDDVPNAVAFSDGSVFIHTGLLKRLQSEAELAFVLGHEIAHVTNEHARRRFEAQQDQARWAALIGVGASVLGQNTGLLMAQLSYKLMSGKFSKDMEEQADRVGLYYAYDAGYDVREGANVWRRMMGIYREVSTGVVLYVDNNSLLERLKDTRREMILNYSNADFSEHTVGREKFVEGVGVYFGWIQPKPKPNVAKTTPKTTKIKPQTPAQIKRAEAAALQKKISSLIAFVVKETKQGASPQDVYVWIALEGFNYVAAIKTGRIIKKTKSQIKSFADDYAEIGVNTMNSKMQTTGQGGTWLLKQNGNTWTSVGMDEGGDYQCDELKSVPQSVRQTLKIQCS